MKNIKHRFENNVFNKEGKVGNKLYYMVMKYVKGNDLFFTLNGKDVDKEELDKLGDMLYNLLEKCSICKVTLRDIKLKNIIKDDKTGKFVVIDLQTLGIDNKDLTDSLGTPEYWPLIKIFDNIYNKKKDNPQNGEEFLYNVYFSDARTGNFADMYSSCEAMYAYNFKRLTATGLLILLFKYLVLDNDKGKNFNNDINALIKYLKEYKEHYENYVHNKNNNKKQNDVDKYFFEEVDDRNLNENQKKTLAKYLAKFIKYVNNTKKDQNFRFNIDAEELKNLDDNDIDNIDGNLEDIYDFYKEMVELDLKNFDYLKENNYKYAYFMKHILFMGSLLNYNYSGKEVNDILNNVDIEEFLAGLDLVDNIENGTEIFFKKNNTLENIEKALGNCYNQDFIEQLLNEFVPLKVYYRHSDAIAKNRIKIAAERFGKYSTGEEEIKTRMKAFYLLKHIDNKKLLYVPVNIIKSLKLIEQKNNI
jgi:hypothetical protein